MAVGDGLPAARRAACPDRRRQPLGPSLVGRGCRGVPPRGRDGSADGVLDSAGRRAAAVALGGGGRACRLRPPAGAAALPGADDVVGRVGERRWRSHCGDRGWRSTSRSRGSSVSSRRGRTPVVVRVRAARDGDTGSDDVIRRARLTTLELTREARRPAYHGMPSAAAATLRVTLRRCVIRCLLLDATMRPTTLVARERAVSLVVCGHAQVIAEDPEVVYRSEHLRVALPVILQVPAYVELRPIVKRNVVRRVLFCRDGWRCAYCGRDGGPRDLTVDHVKPLSRGGEHAWDNVGLGLPALQPPQGRPAALRGGDVSPKRAQGARHGAGGMGRPAHPPASARVRGRLAPRAGDGALAD